MSRFTVAALTLGGALLAGACSQAAASDELRVPAPKVDVPPTAGLRTAVLAGGCFWGLEGIFEHVKGVRDVTSGFAGGDQTTKPAEAVRIVYDPRQVSYGTLLRIYFAVTTDPTQLNRQGPDTGPGYRSALFPQDALQERTARAYLAQLAKAKVWDKPIVTGIEHGAFRPAPAGHQDFMRRNPAHPYILMWDRPKLAELKRHFPQLYRS